MTASFDFTRTAFGLPPKRTIELAGGGRVELYPEWLAQGEADMLYECLRVDTPWEQRSLTIAGRAVPVPRLTAWYGPYSYSYSGIRHSERPMPMMVDRIASRAAAVVGSARTFNSVLLNLYRDERDSVSMHGDDEPELGIDPVIASVSLGAERRFLLRYVGPGQKEPGFDLTLPHGSLLIMSGTTQRYWRHGVPKEKASCGPRVNLTFRRIVT